MDKVSSLIKGNKYLIAILVVTFIAYLPSINGEFLNWDDDIYILNNPSLTSLSIDNIKIIFSEFYYGLYNPLTNLSWAIDYSLAELNPFIFHFHNIVLHLLNVVLIFLLFKNYLIKNKEIAIITASLFAIAPIHVESVAWITERKDVLYTAYYLISIIFYLRYIDEKKNKFLLLAFLSFVFSIFSKGMAASLPLLLIVIDYFKNRKLFAIKTILEKIPFFIISLIMGILNIFAQRDFYGIRKDVYSISEQISFSSYSFVQYIIKSFIPYKLSAFYPYPEESTSSEFWLFIIPVFIIIGVFIYSIIKKRKNIVLGISFFVLNIIFVLQLFLHNTEAIISERYAYLSSIGIYFLFALLINYFKEKNNNKNLIKYSFIILLLIFSIMSFNRNKVWQNDLTLFLDAHEKQPNSYIITNNIGNSYLRNKDLKNAEIFFKKTIELNPNYSTAYSNLGGVLGLQNNFKDALYYFNKIIKIDNKKALLYSNRAQIYLQKKDYDNAINDCDTALKINKEFCKANVIKAITYCYQEKLSLARKEYNIVKQKCNSEIPKIDIEFNKYADYYNKLGIQSGKKGELEQAIIFFNKALILKPENKNVKMNKEYAQKMLNKKLQ